METEKREKKDDKHLKTERTTFGDFLRGKFHFSYLGCGTRDGDTSLFACFKDRPSGLNYFFGTLKRPLYSS